MQYYKLVFAKTETRGYSEQEAIDLAKRMREAGRDCKIKKDRWIDWK